VYECGFVVEKIGKVYALLFCPLIVPILEKFGCTVCAEYTILYIAYRRTCESNNLLLLALFWLCSFSLLLDPLGLCIYTSALACQKITCVNRRPKLKRPGLNAIFTVCDPQTVWPLQNANHIIYC
jgi:hypothetical protein